MYKYEFERLVFSNRWARPKLSREDDWLILGISKWWFSPEQFEYRIGFFGLQLRIWIKRTLI
jgi:hypothetical protein